MIELRSEEARFTRKFSEEIDQRIAGGGRLMSLFLAPAEKGDELIALVYDQGEVTAIRARLQQGESSYPALTSLVPAAHWHERELHDLHGVEPLGHPRLEPLLRHENGERLLEERGGLEHRGHRRLGGPGVFVIPYGPVRSGVFETAQYLVQTSGEDVAYCAQRLFFKRRGAERRICQVPLPLAVLVAERVSGTSSVAHALAFCQALESLAEMQVPASGACDPLGACRARAPLQPRGGDRPRVRGRIADRRAGAVRRAEGTSAPIRGGDRRQSLPARSGDPWWGRPGARLRGCGSFARSACRLGDRLSLGPGPADENRLLPRPSAHSRPSVRRRCPRVWLCRACGTRFGHRSRYPARPSIRCLSAPQRESAGPAGR